MSTFMRALVTYLAFAVCLDVSPFAASADDAKQSPAFGEALFDCTFRPPSAIIPDPYSTKWMSARGLDAFTFLVWAEGAQPRSSLQLAGSDPNDLRLDATKKSEVTLTWAIKAEPASRQPEITLHVDRANGVATFSFTRLSATSSERLTYSKRDGKCVIARRAQ